MIEADQFLRPLASHGYAHWTGVPCSFLTPFINAVIQSDQLSYIGAASEGEAIGVAAGSALAGRGSVAICQNSGLGNMVNPLTSLATPFRIPMLLIVTQRGAPGIRDEPQHELMGNITTRLLDLMNVRWLPFPDTADSVEGALGTAMTAIRETDLPFAFVMRTGSVSPMVLRPAEPSPARAPTSVDGEFTVDRAQRILRLEALRIVNDTLGLRSALVASTGKIGRELCALGHRDNHFYMVGSMGCASAIGLGLSTATRGTPWVTVLDGDGAALMKMGTIATIGHHSPGHFVHIILDNESHESTGGQATVSPTVDFCQVALACGYARAVRVDTAPALGEFLSTEPPARGPILIHMKVARGSDPALGRPTLSPLEVKTRFMDWVQAQSN